MHLSFTIRLLGLGILLSQGAFAFGGIGGGTGGEDDPGEWDNGGGDNEWTTPANWGEDQPPDGSTPAFFGSGTVPNQSINVGSDVTAEGIEFDDGIDGTFTLTGTSTISLTTGIVNEQADVVTINPMIRILDGDFTISSFEESQPGNELVINGGIFAQTSATLTVDASSEANSSVILNGDLAFSITDVDFTGAGTKNLNGMGNAYSGGTTISGGTLNVGGKLPSGTLVSVGSGAVVNMLEDSIFGWRLDTSTANPAGVLNQGTYNRFDVAGTLSGNGAVFDILLAGGSYSETFWNSDKSWSNSISGNVTSNLETVFSGGFSGGGVSSSGLVPGQGQFSVSGNTLTWTAVPEPSSLLVGGLLGLALFQRRRAGVSA